MFRAKKVHELEKENIRLTEHNNYLQSRLEDTEAQLIQSRQAIEREKAFWRDELHTVLQSRSQGSTSPTPIEDLVEKEPTEELYEVHNASGRCWSRISNLSQGL